MINLLRRSFFVFLDEKRQFTSAIDLNQQSTLRCLVTIIIMTLRNSKSETHTAGVSTAAAKRTAPATVFSNLRTAPAATAVVLVSLMAVRHKIH
jgi:hypothetical protein